MFCPNRYRRAAPNLLNGGYQGQACKANRAPRLNGRPSILRRPSIAQRQRSPRHNSGGRVHGQPAVAARQEESGGRSPRPDRWESWPARLLAIRKRTHHERLSVSPSGIRAPIRRPSSRGDRLRWHGGPGTRQVHDEYAALSRLVPTLTVPLCASAACRRRPTRTEPLRLSLRCTAGSKLLHLPGREPAAGVHYLDHQTPFRPRGAHHHLRLLPTELHGIVKKVGDRRP